ncbi:Putative SNARE associated golgi family protein [Septoria linicola]|uniref:Golgi apparatus membrane protein TVP38 n=1 Tax=Septoria linicola TaxID=215465 RepID=A0A9Q9ASZ9_9PEZI|nr:putative SNARE associated golgi family protein [Septoria linicola]USW54575.1 Putative SNARE associated golgi family protein [Septoria linicola]
MGDQEHYFSTARALAAQYNDSSDDESHTLPTSHRSTSHSPLWSRRSLDPPSRQNIHRPQRKREKYYRLAEEYYLRGWRIWSSLSPLQQAGAIAFVIISSILTLLAIIYSERIFHWLAPGAKRWRELPGGWLILWVMTFFVSFPPMIGYSTCVTIGGFVFGMKGWFILASATIVGSTVSFIVSRTFLKDFVSRMTEKNQRFAALSLVLKHDGIKLLIMIRLCPLPYSFSNGAISTIPTVTWQNFMLATAIASPKLLLHIFVGRQLGIIAESGDKMSWGYKLISYTTMAIGIALGIGTGYLIYSRTAARAAALEAEEASAAQAGGRRRGSDVEAGGDYIDDVDERAARDVLRERQSDVSLHTTYEQDLGRGYRDDSEDDEAERDVFDAGDETDDDRKGSR